MKIICSEEYPAGSLNRLRQKVAESILGHKPKSHDHDLLLLSNELILNQKNYGENLSDQSVKVQISIDPNDSQRASIFISGTGAREGLDFLLDKRFENFIGERDNTKINAINTVKRSEISQGSGIATLEFMRRSSELYGDPDTFPRVKMGIKDSSSGDPDYAEYFLIYGADQTPDFGDFDIDSFDIVFDTISMPDLHAPILENHCCFD